MTDYSGEIYRCQMEFHPTNEGFGLRRMLEACYHRGSQTNPAQS
jgi:hypothetical protein